MEQDGTGAKEAGKTESIGPVANSRTYPRHARSSTPITGKRKRTADLPPLEKSEALDMLASAIAYCRQAGLKVSGGNTARGLTLLIEGAQVATDNGATRFILSGGNSVPVATTDGTRQPNE